MGKVKSDGGWTCRRWADTIKGERGTRKQLVRQIDPTREHLGEDADDTFLIYVYRELGRVRFTMLCGWAAARLFIICKRLGSARTESQIHVVEGNRRCHMISYKRTYDKDQRMKTSGRKRTLNQ